VELALNLRWRERAEAAASRVANTFSAHPSAARVGANAVHMRNLLIAAAFALCTSASAEPLEQWSLPAPDEMLKASNVLCVDQAKSALLAWQLKRKGRSAEEVLALIPQSPKALSLRLVSAMHENVEDVYVYPNLSQYTLYSFRSEVCVRETLGAVRMPRLSAMYDKLAECQKTHGPEKSTQLFKCVQAVVREAEPK
jgi:hypothetical protein